jgi:hypothetical protein
MSRISGLSIAFSLKHHSAISAICNNTIIRRGTATPPHNVHIFCVTYQNMEETILNPYLITNKFVIFFFNVSIFVLFSTFIIEIQYPRFVIKKNDKNILDKVFREKKKKKDQKSKIQKKNDFFF